MKRLLTFVLFAPLAASCAAAQEPTPATAAQDQEKKEDKGQASKPAEPKTEQKAEAQPAKPEKTPSELALTGSADIGYRWVSDVGGSRDAYRSLVNLGEGPKLLGIDFRLDNPSKRFFDRITGYGSGWGGDPYTTTRVDVFKQRAYDLTFDYRNIVYFDALPSYADPLISRGIVFDERSYDMHRRWLESRLDLFPGKRIIPYLVFNQDWGAGSGIVPFVNSAVNEYPVFNSLRDRTDRYAGGIRFEFSRFHLTLEQGGTTFKDDQNVSISSQNFGNRTTPFLGQTLFINSVNQAYGIRADSIFERGLFTASPVSWLDLSGQFLYTRPRTDVHFTQLDAGNLVDLSTATFYSTGLDVIAAEAAQPHSSGSFAAEVRPFRRLRIVESWMTDRYHTASADALSQITGQISSQSTAVDRLDFNYSRQQAEAIFDVTSSIVLRGGYRYVWGDALVRGPVTTGTLFEQGQLRQNVGLAGLVFRPSQKLSVTTDYEGASADKSYFRTSLHDYNKGSVRARYQVRDNLNLNVTALVLDNQNPTPGINYDFRNQMYSASLFWNPGFAGKRFNIIGDYTRSLLYSNITYFVPQSGATALSNYTDNGHSATAMLDVNLPAQGHISLGGSFFQSSGSRPTQYYQPLGRVSLRLHKGVFFQSEWRYYGLSENFYVYEGFRVHMFTAGLHLVR